MIYVFLFSPLYPLSSSSSSFFFTSHFASSFFYIFSFCLTKSPSHIYAFRLSGVLSLIQLAQIKRIALLKWTRYACVNSNKMRFKNSNYYTIPFLIFARQHLAFYIDNLFFNFDDITLPCACFLNTMYFFSSHLKWHFFFLLFFSTFVAKKSASVVITNVQ